MNTEQNSHQVEILEAIKNEIEAARNSDQDSNSEPLSQDALLYIRF